MIQTLCSYTVHTYSEATTCNIIRGLSPIPANASIVVRAKKIVRKNRKNVYNLNLLQIINIYRVENKGCKKLKKYNKNGIQYNIQITYTRASIIYIYRYYALYVHTQFFSIEYTDIIYSARREGKKGSGWLY